jgi:hypothetical protein
MIAMMPNKIDKINYGQMNYLDWRDWFYICECVVCYGVMCCVLWCDVLCIVLLCFGEIKLKFELYNIYVYIWNNDPKIFSDDT